MGQSQDKRRKMKSLGHTVLILVLVDLCSEMSASVLENPTFSGPKEALLGEIVEFNCESPPIQETVTYQFLKAGEKEKAQEYTSLTNETATFNLVVKTTSEGLYYCNAFVENNTSIEPQSSSTIRLKVIIPVKGVRLESDPGPDQADLLEGEKLTLSCKVTEGTHLFYEWYFNRSPIPDSLDHRIVENKMIIDKIVDRQAGTYFCIASNGINETHQYSSTSNDLVVAVKVPLSKPVISYTVTKEASTLQAIITCNSTRGSPPITFSLYNKTNGLYSRTAQEQSALFTVPLTQLVRMGAIYCEAKNEVTQLQSNTSVRLDAVGGEGRLQTEHFYEDNGTVLWSRLCCSVERGTFPQFTWFLNGLPLEKRVDSLSILEYTGSHNVSCLIPTVRGSYHCEASDEFDFTHRVVTKGFVVNPREFKPMSVEVIAVLLSGFILLIITVATCCLFLLLRRKKRKPEESGSDVHISEETGEKRVLETEQQEQQEQASGKLSNTGLICPCAVQAFFFLILFLGAEPAGNAGS
uniref:Ig-like domain-containing protein n=1 Tax=Lepisosteus oculatus TaxID=7918 RepID=W5N4M3_LEPOC